jgi:phospholipid/cholesterol/gamma-HCH transport system substrate-binding protein
VVDNAAYITYDLSEIIATIREGEGTAGKLLMDTSFAEDIDKTVGNLKAGTRGFKENMEAAKSNFLLRGYFKKKERERKKTQEERGKN